jgi:hypothetical protein
VSTRSQQFGHVVVGLFASVLLVGVLVAGCGSTAQLVSSPSDATFDPTASSATATSELVESTTLSSAPTTTTVAPTTTTTVAPTTTTAQPTSTTVEVTTTVTETTTTTVDDSGSYTVYVTKTGTKYHRGSCSSLSKSKIPMTLAEAKAEGYEPCKICKPPS